MKKKKGGVLIRLGVIMLAAAAALGGYNVYDSFRAGSAANESVRHLESVIMPQQAQSSRVETTPVPGAVLSSDVSMEIPAPGYVVTDIEGSDSSVELPISGDGTAAEGTNTPVQLPVSGNTGTSTENRPQQPHTDDPIAEDIPEEVEIPDYILNPNMEMPVSRYNGQDYIGILEIPALELKIPVISKWNYPRLRIAPCRYSGSAYTNNLVISAHNYATHFGNLNKLYEGAAVRFTDVDGNVFNYRVGMKETLNPRDVEYMQDSGWDLTLFTCTPGGSYRVTVRCALMGSI